jgi:hypothetical protein
MIESCNKGFTILKGHNLTGPPLMRKKFKIFKNYATTHLKMKTSRNYKEKYVSSLNIQLHCGIN